MLSYYVIYFEKFKKVMQRTEKEALTLTGLEGHICPSLVKRLEGHKSPSVVTS